MKKDDALRKKLTESFEDFEVEPQGKTWENIQAAIRPKRKRRPALLILLGVAIAGLLLGGAYWISNSMRLVANTYTDVSASIKYGKCISTRTVIEVKNKYSFQVFNQMPGPKPLKKDQGGIPPIEYASVVLQVPSQTTILVADTTQDSNILDETTKLSGLDTIVDRTAQLNLLQMLVKSPIVIQNMETNDDPIPEPVKIHQDKPVRKARYLVGLNVLSAYQMMETQWINGFGAGNIQVTPALDTRRLGTAWMVGYRMPMQKRSDIGIGFTWMNLPYRADYTVRSTNQVTIELQSTTQYVLQTSSQNTVSDERRLNWVGVQAEYGYTCKVFRREMRLFAGTEALYATETAQVDFWIQTGLEFPIGRGKYSLCPVAKYQLGRIQQPDQLLKTRLYTLGLGVKRTF